MSKHHLHRHSEIQEIKDPVCKMKISPKGAIDAIDYDGITYYFCSTNCRNDFELDPDKYQRSIS